VIDVTTTVFVENNILEMLFLIMMEKSFLPDLDSSIP